MKQETRIQKALRLHRTGLANEAADIYRKVLKKNPKDVDALHFYGVLQFQQGHVDRALELIERALSEHPAYPDALNNLGNILLRLGRVEEARRRYEQVLALQPDRLETCNNLGVALRHLGDYAASAGYLRRALSIKPDWADAHYNLANTLADDGDGDAAQAGYRKALELDPRYGEALRRLGIGLYRSGRRDEAIAFYREWLDLQPAHPTARHMLAAFTGEAVPERAAPDYIVDTFDRFAGSFDSQLDRLDYRVPGLVGAAARERWPQARNGLAILDAGCGTGLCGAQLRPLARRLVGVDLSPGMLKLAAQRGCYDELARSELVEYLQRSSEQFDAISCADTLVYFGSLAAFFAGAATRLQPGGALLFSVESLASDSSPYRLETHGRYAHGEGYVRATLAGAGLAVASMDAVVLRKELGRAVEGWFVVAERRQP